MQEKYEHGRKAGNMGDVFKHVALIAGLRETCSAATHDPFRYADTFAAYAMNILKGEDEWKQGIGKLDSECLLKGNPDVAFWATRWLDGIPKVSGRYPGSSWFARETCKSLGRDIQMSLWEIAEKPLTDLRAMYPDGHVFSRPAKPDDPNIIAADFVFIDPPSKDDWEDILGMVKSLSIPPKQSVLVWLPIGPNTGCSPPIEDKSSGACRQQGLKLGLSTTTVRWHRGGRMIGCQLLYRVNPRAQQALRRAVEDLFECTGFQFDDVLGVRHFDS